MTSVSKSRPGPKPRPVRERLLSKAVINFETGCWEWNGQLNSDGYARFGVTAQKNTYAHRLAYELIEGPIPAGLTLDHLCRVRHCINPAHLEPVTSRENSLRSPFTMASRHAATTHCPSGHEYTPENTMTVKHRNGRVTRVCRTCRRAYVARKRAERQEATA